MNKGKRCGQVCRRCRHISKVCPICDLHFDRDTAYLNHTKICVYKAPAPTLVPPSTHINIHISPTQVGSKELVSTVPNQALTKIKPKIIYKGLVNMDDIYSKMQTMLEYTIDKRLATVQNVNITNNINNTVIYQHFTVSDIGAFKILCDKMGTAEATEFLCKLAAKPQVMTLFEKLYLECDPSNYPIANNNGKDFFYRDVNDNIVHDEGGHKIAKLGERLMKNTFLEAADPLLTRFVKQNEGDHDGDDNDYDKFRGFQNAAHASKTERSFIKDLYPKTYNPNHMFFTEHKT